MSPFEHGETFVLDDGGETDLDLGNYERFLDLNLTRDHNITTGKIYASVIAKERRGDYLGKTVQVVPHVTDEIQAWIERVALIPTDGKDGPPDVCLIELGGTVGDIESSVFLEAIRQFQFNCAKNEFCLVHVSLVPCLGSVGEQKTKPTQHGIKELRGLGLSPDFLVCRSATELLASTREKLGIFCQVPASHVISVHDVSNIYHVPLILHDQNIDQLLFAKLDIFTPKHQQNSHKIPNNFPICDLTKWRAMAQAIDSFDQVVTIALVGKYTGLADSYLSVLKALKHSAIEAGCALDIAWIESSDLEPPTQAQNELDRENQNDTETRSQSRKHAWDLLEKAHGVVVPGGFGSRGIEGMIACAKFCRTRRKPYLGICLGMQLAVIEFARAFLPSPSSGKSYTSAEFDDDYNQAKDSIVKPHHAVVFMPEIDKHHMGGTMRLGARDTLLVSQSPKDEPSLAAIIYGQDKDRVTERHRHRYEVNPQLVPQLENAGLRFIGKDESGSRMEIIELPRSVHPYFFGVQYHPEFLSRPQKPSPPFFGLILAAIGRFDRYYKINLAPPTKKPRI
eukprot:CAMPEP_0197320566 /NCGR_PEP_ID=MMETSP0891-20130614/60747_1 /TAXON_ID=44058 ORGANISM="Aureoumbra lagunensis, Strain CCMP1510" /NCGR_SAMPLE_ID=MMETSP0891 /ASSEMBLY_ACC=CAM_ASM_000534 /LENGTH=564 /DNA_ID=CAMNT_0042812037 /DNA_START=206 /DNA_END=1900 /DNA_ORIENTATION=-